MKKEYLLILALVVCSGISMADTFTHRTSKTVYHGYATQTVNDGKTLVHTQQQGSVELNLAEFDVVPDRKGRNNTICVISVKDAIQYDLETAAFEKAVVEESNKGPLFLLIEIDSPGGKTNLAERMCSAITNTRNCRTVAFVNGGVNGGAYSAAAAVALACNEIYMAPAASIGAATQYVRSSSGKIYDMKAAFGDNVGEKFQSIWRNFLAALAQQNGRSGLVAKAMVDKDIEVLQVQRSGKTVFIEAHEKAAGDQVVRVLCKKGEVMTLPAADAATCTIADAVVETRGDLLKHLDCADTQVIVNPDMDAAKEELEKVIQRFNKLNSALEMKYKELEIKAKSGSMTKSQLVKDFQSLVKNGEYLLKLKQTYPDVPADEEDIQEFVNDMKATYQGIKSMR